MIIKEKRYIKKCDCGTEIIYTRRDCYHNTTWDIYSLYCPSCSHEYSYRRGTHHDLFDKEYEEDSVDKDEEIERLNNIINELEIDIENRIYMIEPKGTHINFNDCDYECEENYINGVETRTELDVLKYILNKLQELKEGKKSEKN